MFIHIGSDEAVLTKDVIMIIDQSAMEAKETEEFLQIAKEEGFISDEDWNLDPSKKKTAIIMDKRIVFSPISSTTLHKRATFVRKLKGNCFSLEV